MSTLLAIKHKIQSAIHHQVIEKKLEWMHTLPEMDELAALKEITTRLAKIQFDSSKSIHRDIDLLLDIDSKTYRSAKNITYKYLTMLKINRDSEDDIFNVGYSFHRQLYLAYSQFLDVYQAQCKVVLDLEKMNLILARHINATNAMTKWRYFDDQPAPAGTWENVNKVIKCAENLSILNINLFLYEYQRKETSLATLLKQGFMMATLHKGSYSRLQIQLTEQILKVWASNPLLLNKHKLDKYQFFINTESDRGPERIRIVEKFTDYRYWKTTRLIDKIERFLCAVDTNKSVSEFGLDKMASTSVLVKLFKKLRVDWCVEGYERQRRKEVRNKRNKLITVNYGLVDICRSLNAITTTVAVVKQTPDDNQYDFNVRVASHHIKQTAPQVYQPKKNNLGSENWWVVDESIHGFGVDLGKTYNDWIEPGRLISYTTPENRDKFVIAEIKSIRKQANGSYRAGLEVLGTESKVVQLGRVDKNNLAEVADGYFVDDSEAKQTKRETFSGLLLNYQAGSQSRKASIVMPRKEYKRGNKIVINHDSEEEVLEMGALLSKQRDWVRIALPI